MLLYIRIINWAKSRIFFFLFGHTFGRLGLNSRIISPVAIEGAGNIFVGDNVLVATHSCLAAVPLTGASACQLIIDDGCLIGRFNHVYATNSIVIEKNVLTANNVYISDNSHAYNNPALPIRHQPITQKGIVIIGEGTWIGHNACIIGARIGKNCVIGANSVVTHDIPDYCVAVGAPAKVIKRYDPVSNAWVNEIN